VVEIRTLLIVYDNLSYHPPLPQGIAYITAILEEMRCDVDIYQQDLYHWPEEHLTEYLNNNDYDIVGLGIIAGYYQYQKLLKISKAINKSKNRNKLLYILGGHGPCADPNYFLKKTKADIIVLGEGEETIKEIVNNLKGPRCIYKIENIRGIAYRMGDDVYINEERELIKDIDSIPFPAYHKFPIEFYRLQRYVNNRKTDFVMNVLSSRGCIFNCSFCWRMDKSFRPRKVEAILDEIRLLQKNYGINYIDFSDELLMSSEQRSIEVCEGILNSELKFRWSCDGRLNYATKEVLKLMKKAGCVFINYGIEALDNNVLRLMKKGLTVDIIIKGVENTLEVGISPGLNIMFGNPGDNRETLKKAVDFLLKYDDCAQLRTIRPMTPYPNCPLYYKAIKDGLIKDIEDFYENLHINSDLVSVNFIQDKMTTDEIHKELYEANCKIINNYYSKHAGYMKKEAYNLYIKKDVSFRGYRQF